MVGPVEYLSGEKRTDGAPSVLEGPVTGTGAFKAGKVMGAANDAQASLQWLKVEWAGEVGHIAALPGR